MEQQASVDAAAREVKKGQAFDLRIAGANYREIAKVLGISVSTAHEYVTDALLEVQNVNAETVARLRIIEKARLEAVLKSLWSKKDNPRYADSIVRISQRISALEGLDLGKSQDELPPPPPVGAGMPAEIRITLVAPAGTTAQVVETIQPAGETKGPAGETIP